MSSLDRIHKEYGTREMRLKFSLRVHGTLTLVGSRAETDMPPGKLSVMGKRRAQLRSSVHCGRSQSDASSPTLDGAMLIFN